MLQETPGDPPLTMPLLSNHNEAIYFLIESLVPSCYVVPSDWASGKISGWRLACQSSCLLPLSLSNPLLSSHIYHDIRSLPGPEGMFLARAEPHSVPSPSILGKEAPKGRLTCTSSSPAGAGGFLCIEKGQDALTLY